MVTETKLDGRITEYFGVTMPGPFRPYELHIGREYRGNSLERFAAIPEGGNRSSPFEGVEPPQT